MLKYTLSGPPRDKQLWENDCDYWYTYVSFDYWYLNQKLVLFQLWPNFQWSILVLMIDDLF
jgi:hypothetical protein